MKTLRLEDKLFLDGFRPDDDSHLVVKDQKVCAERCECRVCLEICPAKVYRWEHERVVVFHEGCLECGTCRIACPEDNLDWRYPRGGFGINHRYG